MLVWRLTRMTHADEPLTGEGAQRFGGRWNHPGTPVVYTSATLSLAVLEFLVNLPIIDLPNDLVSIRIDVPDGLNQTNIVVDDLPDNWRAFPAIEDLRDIGTDWVRESKTAVLAVPSVVIPNELNYVINPAHRDVNRLEVVSIEPFALDTRLLHARKPIKEPGNRFANNLTWSTRYSDFLGF
jgi:RES domain-containing protein